MAYTGCTIALDLAGTCGVAEGCAGEKPVLTVERFARSDDDLIEAPARAIGFIADRLSAERWIDGRLYARGEAVEAGLIRVAIEKPLTAAPAGTMALVRTMLLVGAVAGFAHRRGAMVRLHPAPTVRKAFIGVGNLKRDPAKAEVRRVCEALGWEPPNFDAADAAAVWWFACQQWAPERVPDTRPHFSQLRRAA